jgi:hypothetical protein
MNLDEPAKHFLMNARLIRQLTLKLAWYSLNDKSKGLKSPAPTNYGDELGGRVPTVV